MAAAATPATVEGTLGIGAPGPVRLVTHSLGAPHWITLGPIFSPSVPREVYLTDRATEAAWIDYVQSLNVDHSFGYKLHLTMPEEGIPHLVRLTGGSAAVGTTLEAVRETPEMADPMTHTPGTMLWEREVVAATDAVTEEETCCYTLRTSAAPALAVCLPGGSSVSLQIGILESPLNPVLVFATEYLCECRDCWTTSNTGICTFCRAQTSMGTTILPQMLPCDCCGTPTPYGGFCSSDCRADATGVWR
jgi:hypothetical protein